MEQMKQLSCKCRNGRYSQGERDETNIFPYPVATFPGCCIHIQRKNLRLGIELCELVIVINYHISDSGGDVVVFF
jgi:hypothetical protein